MAIAVDTAAVGGPGGAGVSARLVGVAEPAAALVALPARSVVAGSVALQPGAASAGPAPLPARAAAGPAGVITGMLEQVNAAVVGFFDSVSRWVKTLPAPVTEWMSGALLLVRRTLFNQAPTVSPVQQWSDGQLIGDLRATDPEGEALSYSVAGTPRYGDFTLSSDGIYTYRPFTADDADGLEPALEELLFVVADVPGGANLLNPGYTGTTAIPFTLQNLSGADVTDLQACIKDKDCSDQDLAGADLSRKNVAGVNFTGADLTVAKLEKTDVTEANFTRADLTGAQLGGVIGLRTATLTESMLKGWDLSGQDLSGADLTGANLTAANLTKANLTDAILNRATLTRSTGLVAAVLVGADLSGVDLTGQNLSKQNLTGAILTDTNLSGANLTGANLTNAILKGATLTGSTGLVTAVLVGADLSGVDLTGQNLSKRNLTGAILTGANLTGANLTGANLTNAILKGATLTGSTGLATATLTGAALAGANLAGMKLVGANLTNFDLTDADLTGANLTDVTYPGVILTDVTWKNTVCPDGTTKSVGCRSTLTGGQKLLPGQAIYSPDDRYSLLLQPDGNLVMWESGKPAREQPTGWQSFWGIEGDVVFLTSTQPGFKNNKGNLTVTEAVLQGSDGNFGVYSGATRLWSILTKGYGDGLKWEIKGQAPYWLELQNDRNLVLYSDTEGQGRKAVWDLAVWSA